MWLLLLACVFAPPSSVAQLQDENAVKAAFVLNATKYIEWPQDQKELVIGFVGDSALGTVLKKMLDGKTSGTRLVRVVISPNAAERARCDVLYIAYSSRQKDSAELQKLRRLPILTIGDTEWFARDGGVMALVTENSRVRIVINVDASAAAQLKVSSRLLNLATIVNNPGAARSQP